MDLLAQYSDSDGEVSAPEIRWMYCCWKKSCTSWYVVYPISIPLGTGFYTFLVVVWDFFHQQYGAWFLALEDWGEQVIWHWGCQMHKVWQRLLLAEFCVVLICSLWLRKHSLWQMTTSCCCCVCCCCCCCCMDTGTRWQWFDHVWSVSSCLIMACFLVNLCVCLSTLLSVIWTFAFVFVSWAIPVLFSLSFYLPNLPLSFPSHPAVPGKKASEGQFVWSSVGPQRDPDGPFWYMNL